MDDQAWDVFLAQDCPEILKLYYRAMVEGRPLPQARLGGPQPNDQWLVVVISDESQTVIARPILTIIAKELMSLYVLETVLPEEWIRQIVDSGPTVLVPPAMTGQPPARSSQPTTLPMMNILGPPAHG